MTESNVAKGHSQEESRLMCKSDERSGASNYGILLKGSGYSHRTSQEKHNAFLIDFYRHAVHKYVCLSEFCRGNYSM